jgi:hypothetical protein
MKKVITLSVALILLLGVALVPGMTSTGSAGLAQAPEGGPEGPAQPDVATEAGVEEALLNLPLYFIENQGQMDQRVAYYVQGSDMNLYFTAQGVTFVLRGPGEEADSQERYALKLDFVGADPDVQPVGNDRTEAVISYFKGSPEEWKTGLPTYAGITYPDLWPGIDLVYGGDASRLKYAFHVQRGADPGQIRLAYHGASDVTLNGAGQLEVSTPAGGFNDDRPVAYQDAGGQRVPVESSYALDEQAHSYGFEVGSYDPGRPLVIDPAVLVYCGYIGGEDKDFSNTIAVDGSGCAYVTGMTESDEITEGFPVIVGPNLTFNGSSDAFVAKVNAGGTGLVYCGYIGGDQDDGGGGIAVDGSGCAYVTGETGSNVTEGFPVIVGPDTSFNGQRDAFVAKVNAGGTGLVYCGYIGGEDNDGGMSIALDNLDCAYVTGGTWSDEGEGFPVNDGPDLTFNGGLFDAFVAKVKADGTELVYCGYIGGDQKDEGRGIAVDGSRCAYVTGSTESDVITDGFPVVVGPDTSFNDDWDAFVAKVNAGGTGLDYCGYIGGEGDDRGEGIAVDGSGCAYVTGETRSDQNSFPDGDGFGALTGPDLIHNGQRDAFVAKVNDGGTGLDYCGYIGGEDHDRGMGIAVDGPGCAYVTGTTGSNVTEGFPVVVGPDLTHNGDEDAFVAKVNAGGTGLVCCGYIGGEDVDEGMSIALDNLGCAYVTGYTRSPQATFPDGDGFGALTGPDLTHNGDFDAFVAKVCYTMPVGGIVEPVDRLQIMAPWLGLAALIVVAITTAVVIRRRAT